MARSLAEIDWNDMTEAAPAVVAAITMPLTYSIATGIGLGFITYALAIVATCIAAAVSIPRNLKLVISGRATTKQPAPS